MSVPYGTKKEMDWTTLKSTATLSPRSSARRAVASHVPPHLNRMNDSIHGFRLTGQVLFTA